MHHNIFHLYSIYLSLYNIYSMLVPLNKKIIYFFMQIWNSLLKPIIWIIDLTISTDASVGGALSAEVHGSVQKWRHGQLGSCHQRWGWGARDKTRHALSAHCALRLRRAGGGRAVTAQRSNRRGAVGGRQNFRRRGLVDGEDWRQSRSTNFNYHN